MFAELRTLKLDIEIMNVYDKQLDAIESELIDLDCAGLDSEAKEHEWDVIYQAQDTAYKDAVRLIKRLSGGRIDTATARQMLTEKQRELMELLNRAA